MEPTKLDTARERAAFAAANPPKQPDPVASELQALRVGLTDVRDAITALRADVSKLTEAMTVRQAVERGFDL